MAKNELPATLEVPGYIRLLLEHRVRDEVMLMRVREQRKSWKILEDRLVERLQSNKYQLRDPAIAMVVATGKKTLNTPWAKLQVRTAKEEKLKAPRGKDDQAELIKALRKDAPHLVTTEVAYVYDWQSVKKFYAQRMKSTGVLPPECIDMVPAGDHLVVSILPSDTDLLMDGSSLLRSLVEGDSDEEEETATVSAGGHGSREGVRGSPGGPGHDGAADDTVGRPHEPEVGDGDEAPEKRERSVPDGSCESS